MADLQPIEEAPGNNKPAAYISDRHRNPDEVQMRPIESGNYTLAGICAIVATVVYVVIVALLWFDWDKLHVA